MPRSHTDCLGRRLGLLQQTDGGKTDETLQFTQLSLSRYGDRPERLPESDGLLHLARPDLSQVFFRPSSIAAYGFGQDQTRRVCLTLSLYATRAAAPRIPFLYPFRMCIRISLLVR
jgi:hypothetical protein